MILDIPDIKDHGQLAVICDRLADTADHFVEDHTLEIETTRAIVP
jgi:hypothetical protein